MSSGFLLLHLFLWSFSTSISNGPTGLTSAARVEPSASHDTRDGSSDTRSGLPIDFPANIIVQRELRAAVARLWAGSATFRAQCAKIGERRFYRVAVLLDPVLSLKDSCRAQCVLRVYSSGLVTARVTVPNQGHMLDELIPHELEHVVEHIEGVDVTRNAGKYGTGAYHAGRGRIETIRATRAGRQARAEVYAGERAVGVLTRR